MIAMADEQVIRRVVIVCDTASDIRGAVGQAAVVAARCQADLRGIFYDDESLQRLAGLPFGRQVSLSAADVSEAVGDLAKLSSALGASMRRALEEAAAVHRLAWTFDATRDLAASQADVFGAGDLLVVERHGRAFSGAWAPKKQWQTRLAAVAATVLIRGHGAARGGVVILLPEDQAAQRHVLGLAANLVDENDPVTVLAVKPPTDDTIMRAFGAERRRAVRVEAIKGGMDALRQKLANLAPALVMFDAQSVGQGDFGALVADARYDVLLVR